MLAYGLHQAALDFFGRARAVTHYDFLHAVHTKLFVVPAFDFGDAVGIEHKPIAAFQLQLCLLVRPFGEQAEHSSANAQLKRSAIGTDQNGRIVSSVAVAQSS